MSSLLLRLSCPVLAVAPLLAAGQPQSRPNVLFIAVDDLRVQLGCYGDPAAITPNLDRLAGRGVVFERAYCQQAVCGPSRQSLLTGRCPDSLRIWDLKTFFRDTAPDAVPLPEHFRNNGYFARSFGKIYHDGLPDPRSWSVPSEYEAVSKQQDYRLPENKRKGKGGKAAALEFVDAPDDAYIDGKVASGAVAALEKLAADPSRPPFFLAVGIRKPHLPFTAPKKYWDLYEGRKIPAIARAEPPSGAPALALHDSEELRGYDDQPALGPWPADKADELRRAYCAAASFADAQIGRVLDALERSGLEKDTIVVVWGDHGYHLGEHGLWAKATNYEADTRVPLIVALPDGKGAGGRAPGFVELLDVYPTLVELCGLPRPAGLEGRSFAGSLGDPAAAGRPYVFSQFPRPWPLGKKKPSLKAMGYSVRTSSHRYVEWRDMETGRVLARELYAYGPSDLFETENLAPLPGESARLEELARLLPAAGPLNRR